MDMGIRGKVALVTGGSRGLGRAMALGLAAEGCRVAIVARGQETLDATVGELQALEPSAIGVAADMTSDAEIARAVETVQRTLGPIDILINNAGGSRGGSAPTDADWQATLDLNLFAAIRTTRLALPAMQERGWGRIINVSSIYGRESGGGPTYNAAKSALISYSKAVSTQAAPHGVTVNALCPGSIAFPGGGWQRRQEADPEGMARFVELNIPAGRFGHAEEVGAVAVFLASAPASWVTGAAITVDGGQSKSNI
ncbi:MAG: SDR family NAD(P)-dependent oxidoreductase [Chloroflexi bacterium]|nr:SDR family NAD(P)-dependent oxidoreductase [Chloroflexota bacterium]